ncbi:hypothetical protein [Nocardia bovistercoris]|nr:hypothetical protein [Nocardia bovistercoris]
MLDAANNGQLSIKLTPEDFVYLDRDCEFFKRAIRRIQQIATEVSQQDHWGLGEANDDMVSGRALVGRFKVKARDAPDGNDVFAIMEQHYSIIEDIQAVHRMVRDRMMQADSAFAAEFTRLNTDLPERPPVDIQRCGPIFPSQGTTR